MQLRFGYWGEAASERDNFRSLTGELGRSSERAIWGLGRSSERATSKPPNKSMPARGLSVWKARNNTGGNGSNSNTEIHSAKSVADSGNARSSRAPKRMTDPRQIYTCLSTSFRSFKFDIPPILVGESIRLWTCVICNSRMVLKS
ncbi:hypothetical protein QQ045_007814 [Rhodiola kirilowii]